jgi:hypothetical protein
MRELRYSFAHLRKHTGSTRLAATQIMRERRADLESGFRAFDAFLAKLESEPASVQRNVRMLLACKFMNHVYAAIVLAESGLFVDAIGCERAGLEALAAYRLVTADPAVAGEYHEGKELRPGAVRHRLETLGHAAEAKLLRELYAGSSETSHVGRAHERFTMKWKRPGDGTLYFGGTFSHIDVQHLMGWLPRLLHWFIDPSKVEFTRDGKAS